MSGIIAVYGLVVAVLITGKSTFPSYRQSLAAAVPLSDLHLNWEQSSRETTPSLQDSYISQLALHVGSQEWLLDMQ